jgi:methionyl-tRNA formyltransferase
MTSTVVIGRGRLAIVALREALAAGHDVRRVVVDTEPSWDVSLSQFARAYPSLDVDMSGDWRCLVGLDVDLILSVGYTRVIGAELVAGAARILNLHLGKLPEYRGMRPVNWALKNGERIAGVTLHEVDSGIDTGPIVAQATFSIWPEVDEVRDVWLRAVYAGEGLLRSVLPIVDRAEAVPQDESRAHYYTAADIGRLGERSDWTRP